MTVIKLGIDVGGTYTDGVIVNTQGKILDLKKIPTQKSISESLELLVQSFSEESRKSITSVHIGTTHGLNALLQGTPLFKVGVLRLMGHKPDLLPIGLDWPSYLKTAVLAGEVSVNGGMECDGRPITGLNSQEILKSAQTLIQKGAESIAVVGVFSPLYANQEIEAVKILEGMLNVPVGRSAPLGGLGIIERENATILNLSLQKSLKQAFCDCEKIFKEQFIFAPIYWVHNQGALLTTKEVMAYPLKTLAAGPINSLMGGARLAKHKNCVVLDIGGTSTDGGVVEAGFVRLRHDALQIAGVDVGSFSSDIKTINLGGGSIVDPSQDYPQVLQEKSVAYR